MVKGEKWWRIAVHLLYTWMMANEDDDRRLPGDPLWILTNVVRWEGLDEKEIEEMLSELHRVKLIVWYEVKGDKYIQVVEKRDMQRIRKDRYKPSIYPPPPQELLDLAINNDSVINSNGSKTAAKQEPNDAKPQTTGDESAPQSLSSSPSPSLSPTPTCDTPERPRLNDNQKFDLFENQFWPIYPDRDGKKTGKAETYKKFCEIPDNEISLCLLAVRNFANSRRVKSGIGIKDPVRFLWNGKTKEWAWKEWIEPEREGSTKQDGISKATQKLKDAIGGQKQITDNAG